MASGPAQAQEVIEISSDDEEEELECFGMFQENIVGIQYYDGVVNNGEMVQLVREPENQYDRWAVRVDNVRGEKVGHLPRTLVCHLAPLMDAGLAAVEGVVPRGAQNVYKMPVHLFLFGHEENRAEVERRMRAGGKALSGQAAGGGGGGRGGASSSAAASPAKLSQRQMEDSIDRLFDELVAASGPRARLNPPAEVLTGLYPHQQEALAWMVQRENGNGLPPFWEPRATAEGGPLTYVSQLTNFISRERPSPLRGGILADDMGLGKTLEVISLICTNRPGAAQPEFFYPEEQQEQGEAEGDEEEDEEERPAKRQRKGKEKATGEKKPKEKKKGKKELEAERLAEAAAQRAAAAEVPAAPPSAGGPRATLIVCPLSVMSNWEMQLEEHTAGTLRVCVYHGTDRDRRVSSLSQFDVVITTYATLAAEADLKNGLCKVDWLRVVLDEAHTIKNPKTRMAKAAHSLRAWSRWAVTGTPVQNSLQDLHGICRFMHLEPLDDRALFTRTIERPVKSRDPMGLKRLQVLMSSIALRRTKDLQVGGRPLVALPPKTLHVVPIQLDRASREKYERWEEAGRRVIRGHLTAGTLLSNYTAVLEILLRLRQICCHASLAPGEDPTFIAQQPASDKLTPEIAAQLTALLKEGLEEECPVCLDMLRLPVITLCKHIFCQRCIQTVIARDKPSCPLCRGPLAEKDLVTLPPEDEPAPKGDEGASGSAGGSGGGAGGSAGTSGAAGAGYGSAKVAALIELIRTTAAEQSGAAGSSAGASAQPERHVVFSQFTSFLDVVGAALAAEGIRTGRLDGKTTAARRAELLRNFQSGSPSSPSVLLVSLKAGGVGLNLTAASRVHLLDPWWNPAVEEQASDRVHRLGQTRPVHIYRYSCEDSIEERILVLQESKRDLMRVAFDRRRPEEMREARIQDVRLLMDL